MLKGEKRDLEKKVLKGGEKRLKQDGVKRGRKET